MTFPLIVCFISSNLFSNQSAEKEGGSKPDVDRPEQDFIILFKGKGRPLPEDLTVDEILAAFSGISQHSISAFDKEPPSGIVMIKRATTLDYTQPEKAVRPHFLVQNYDFFKLFVFLFCQI